MSSYICKNPNCPKFECPETIVRETFKYIGDLGLVGEHAKCPECGELREYVNPKSDIPLSEKNVNLAEYSSKSAEEKRQILKKRSHQHFNSKIKERKDYLNNQAIKEMRDIGKK